MGSLSVSQFIALYTWFPLVVLLFIVLLIARFYQRFSGRRTYYALYLLPIILFGVAIVRYASTEQVTDDPLANIAFTLGGLILIGLIGNLYWYMVIHKQSEE